MTGSPFLSRKHTPISHLFPLLTLFILLTTLLINRQLLKSKKIISKKSLKNALTIIFSLFIHGALNQEKVLFSILLTFYQALPFSQMRLHKVFSMNFSLLLIYLQFIPLFSLILSS